ncbi:hypothetical protein LJC49_05140 [Ruminococcaceae bacterium OttesenSCG-928-I18]|nr:hypothetical protein [Ruminococcaceae bacterium OttesenSCG-928-I18]
MAKELRDLAFPSKACDLKRFLHAVAGEAQEPGGALFVLDNAERLSDGGVLSLVNALIEAEISGLCILLISNTPLAEITSLGSGKQVQVSGEELSFDFEEAERLFAQYGTAKTKQEIEQALAETGGWPLAMHLLCSRPRATTGGYGDDPLHPVITELFERNYYRNYPLETRGLLLKLSHFETLPLGLLRALGICELEHILCLLDHNMFTRYDHARREYAFHTCYRYFCARSPKPCPKGKPLPSWPPPETGI